MILVSVFVAVQSARGYAINWKSVRSFAHKYGFTEAETRAVVFIAVAALTGACYGWFADEPTRTDFREEYRRMDSIFAEQSQMAVGESGDKAGSESAEIHTEEALQPKVDINSAGISALQTIPGIGPSTAKKIIKYRSDSGPFRKLEDLMNVYSIGRKKFEQWKAYIYISE